jgi:peroxiredoxin
MRSRLLLLLIGGLAIGAGIGGAIILGFRDHSVDKQLELTIGSPAPDFNLKTYLGDEVRLSDFKGSPVLINFWATWCQPCRLEMPHIQSRFEQYNTDLNVLAVNFDEPADIVQTFTEELNLTFNVLLDPGGRVQSLYQIRGYPTTYFIDSDGFIRVIHIGFMTESQLDDYLKQVGVGG